MREAKARALLLAHSDAGHSTEGSLRRFLWSGPVRTASAQKNCVKVGSTLKAAAKRLQATDHPTLERPTRFAVSPHDAHEVELLPPAYVEGLLGAGKIATAKKLRNRFQTLH